MYGEMDRVEGKTCPWCGSELVLRSGKYGNFIGCNNFPKCRFSLSLSDEADCSSNLPFRNENHSEIRDSFVAEMEFDRKRHRIRSCPFCGSDKVNVVELEEPYPDVGFSLPDYAVVCQNCGGQGPIVHSTGKRIDTYNSAVDGWNGFGREGHFDEE